MLEPAQKDGILLADISGTGCEGEGFHLWWLGQSGFLLKWRGRVLVFDPYLSDSLSKKYAGTNREHVRMTARCIDPARLEMVAVVTSSHNHTDHLDAETLIPLARANPNLRLILPEANIEFARQRLGAGAPELIGVNDGGSVEAAGFQFRGIPSAHNEIERDAQGRCLYLGFIVRFGPWTIYHSGDTRWHEGLPRLLIDHRPDIVLLPINGYKPERGVAGNLNGTEAAALAKACAARLVVPHHFEMFAFNTETPDEFAAACRRLGQPHRVLRCGERLDSTDHFGAA
jgi:L-ascorbate metabolism protein UlaG (beta-lactamase superfamily)